MTKIEQRFLDAAYLIVTDGYGRFGFGIGELAWMQNAIARALQDAADKARDDENRACENAMKDLRLRAGHPLTDAAFELAAIAIAARRGGG